MKVLSKILILLIFLILSSEINAQKFVPQKVIRKDGWSIPPPSTQLIAGAKGKETLGSNEKISNLKNKIEVDVQGFKLIYPLRVKLEEYFLGEDKSINLRISNYEMTYIAAYSLKDKVFAYSVNYTGISQSGNYLGCMTNYFYLDEDGDGKFETRYNASELYDLPQWVMK